MRLLERYRDVPVECPDCSCEFTPASLRLISSSPVTLTTVEDRVRCSDCHQMVPISSATTVEVKVASAVRQRDITGKGLSRTFGPIDPDSTIHEFDRIHFCKSCAKQRGRVEFYSGLAMVSVFFPIVIGVSIDVFRSGFRYSYLLPLLGLIVAAPSALYASALRGWR